MLYLVKKDMLNIKWYLCFALFLAVGAPLFIHWQAPGMAALPVFLVTAVYVVLISVMGVSLAEYRYPKAAALLCCAPYSRKDIVQAKYLLFVVLYLCFVVVYGVLGLLVPMVERLELSSIVAAFALLSLLCGIYLPVEYKLGYDKSRVVFMLIIVASPMVLSRLAGSGLDLSGIAKLPAGLVYGGLTAGALLILWGSIALSTRIYEKKELL